MCAAHCKNWLAWGEYLDSLAEASGDATVSQEALVCFLQALKAATPADVSAHELGGGIKKRDAEASQQQQQQVVVAARAANYIRVRAVLEQVMAAPVEEEEAAMWAIRVWAVAVAVPSGDSW